jgi:hypothetical protein
MAPSPKKQMGFWAKTALAGGRDPQLKTLPFVTTNLAIFSMFESGLTGSGRGSIEKSETAPKLRA